MKLVFVCAGNICRSATAELIMRRLLLAAGRHDVEVWSAGVRAEVGASMDAGSRRSAEAEGYDCSDHVARQFNWGWIRDADRIIVLDGWAGMCVRLSAAAVPGGYDKIDVIPVSNPWRQSQAAYDRVHRVIEQLCAGLMRDLPQQR